MRKTLITGAIAACALATPAMAAPTITGITVKGTTTNFVWSTAPAAGQDTLFLAPGSGAGVNQVVNPTNNFPSGGAGFGTVDPVSGDYLFTLYGDGYGPVTTAVNRRGRTYVATAPNSDASYTVSVSIKDGSRSGTLTGVYTPTGNAFVSSSVFTGTTGVYQLDGADWGRQLFDYVGTRSTAGTGGAYTSQADYRGDLKLYSSPVPEPATWALMILGFGAVGGALRARRGRQAATAIA